MNDEIIYNNKKIRISDQICSVCGKSIVFVDGEAHHVWEDVYPQFYDHAAQAIEKSKRMNE